MSLLYDPASLGYFETDNEQHTYTYNGPNGAIDTDTVTYNGNNWKKTYTYTGQNFTGETKWVMQ